MNIRAKLLIPAIAMSLITTSGLLVSNIALFSGFVEKSASERVVSALSIAAHHLEDLKIRAASVSLSMSENEAIIDAIARNDRAALLEQARDIQEISEVDYCTITGPGGNVIARAHDPESYGDSVLPQANIRAAIAGERLTVVEQGLTVRLAVRSSIPVYDDSERLAGIVSVGYRLDTETFVDEVKEISGCEATVLLGEERISTTVRWDNGSRAVGTRTDPRIASMFLAGKPYAGEVNIIGRLAVSSYYPLPGPDGKIIGALFTGQYLDEMAKTIWAFVRSGLLITLFMLAAFAAAVIFLVGRIIAPIHVMTRAASALAQGDIDIDIGVNADEISSGETCTLAGTPGEISSGKDHSDEILTLAGAFNRMIENTKRQLHIIEQIAAGNALVSVEMRSDKDVMNRALARLNETILARSAAIREESGRMRAMLDATPLACRLWNRDFKLVECNDAAVKLFCLDSKEEYRARYFELSPEYQPGGQKTIDMIKAAIAEAFEKGECYLELVYSLLDGTPIPTENILVRVPYGGDYVVAAYSRDLREYKKMIAAIERRGSLLRIANLAASMLLDAADDRDIKSVIVKSMGLLGQNVDADRVKLWHSEMSPDGVPRFVLSYEWFGEPLKQASSVPAEHSVFYEYESVPWWEEKLLRGESINGPISALSPAEKEILIPYGIKSILMSPLFLNGRFWGFFSLDDCRRERFFLEDEVNILRSVSLMMIAAVNRAAQTASLREAHSRIGLLINATPLAFNLWDKNLNNIETNDTAVQLFGVKDQKEYLERFYSLSPEYQSDGSSSREKAAELVREAFEKGICRFEWMHQKLDGAPLPMEVTLIRLQYGNDYVVAGYLRDLREQKKMLAAIERRDHLFQTVNQTADILLRAEPEDFTSTLLSCMGMMAGAIRADRVYIFRNYTKDGKLYFTQAYEWTDGAESFQGTVFVTDVSYDDQTPEIMESLLRGECVHSLVRELPPLDRKRLDAQGVLSILTVPVFIENQFWGFVGYDNCHSEELFSGNEESIVRSGSLLIVNALLRNESILKIRDTTAQLETALLDAKEASSAKTSFLAHMSHEIRTPLNAVIGFSELALSGGELSLEVETNVEKIYSAGSTILSIVNNILDISKIESGKFDLYPVSYDTPSLINDTAMLNVVRIGEKIITFKLFVDENLPGKLFGDDLRVKQIFNNLLSNAFKYTNSGAVEWRVTFEQAAPSEDADGNTVDNIWLVSSIRDTGVGMKEEDLSKLFGDYSQVDGKINRKIEGTGLGLSIARRLAEMMNGSISVESEYGKGTTFNVRLLQSAASASPIGAEVAGNLMGMRYSLSRRAGGFKEGRVDLSYARVLVVDDVQTNLDVARGMMKAYKVNIDCASSGQEAIDMIRAGEPRYSAVFMDHMMPGIDGIEATRIIREEIGTDYARGIPIIALTANAIVGNEEMFLSRGFQDFISKPIDLMKLDSVLRRWVRDKDHEQKILNATENTSGEKQDEDSGSSVPRLSPLANITIDGVNKEKALEAFGGQDEILVDVMRSFAADTRTMLVNLGEYLDAENLEDYAIAVHGIKGACYGIAADETGNAAKTLELAAKAKNLDDVKRGHPAFRKMAETLLDNIGKALGELG